MTNTEIARRLQKYARELGHKHDNLYRIRAYRRAAVVVLGLTRPVEELEPWELEALPGIGNHISASIAHLARTGEWKTHQALTSGELAL
ncbi:MAG TPA: helix-hairpin-helix domain-containing protein [Gemmataceae bacterium]|jgi:DNA polymerase (family 10)|nr:helix-hairpin-helix domain-containing protein [Gemmataceae bacterium]